MGRPSPQPVEEREPSCVHCLCAGMCCCIRSDSLACLIFNSLMEKLNQAYSELLPQGEGSGSGTWETQDVKGKAASPGLPSKESI